MYGLYRGRQSGTLISQGASFRELLHQFRIIVLSCYLATINYTYRCTRFRLESHWIKREGFIQEVQKAWNGCEGRAPVNPIAAFSYKLRMTAQTLQSWSAKKFGYIKQKIVWANTLIALLDQAEEARSLTFQEIWFRRELKKKIVSNPDTSPVDGPEEGPGPTRRSSRARRLPARLRD